MSSRLLHEYEEKCKSGVLSLAGREAYEQIVTRGGGCYFYYFATEKLKGNLTKRIFKGIDQ